MVSESSPAAECSRVLGGGSLSQEGDAQELRQRMVKEQKEERGAVGGGRRRTSASSGSCCLDWEDVPRQGPH